MARREYSGKEEVRSKPVVRCKDCIKRFEVPKDASEATCPECGTVWRISWPEPDVPYIRGPK
jgi:DNA-directed RNA polymerase subunit RPC12/RpoP